MKRGLLLLLLLCQPVVANEASPEALDQAAQETAATPQLKIDGLHEVLLSTMQAGTSLEAREEMLRETILDLFDVGVIARISSGRAWRAFSEAEQQSLVAAVEALIVATYADRFESYTGQQFVTLGEAEARTGAIVQTEIVSSAGERTPVDYYFRGDKVFNVVASGVSDLSLRRAEYSAIIKEQGLAQLLEHLAANLAETREQG